ncbi:MAG: Smr/MutS family protein [Acidobacteriota bacterium]|nr:Smr/MutS family protein [Acidobacteriota bacterium]
MDCKLINLEEGRPTVNQGLLRLERALADARARGVCLLKLIHGYGSSGEGGRMKPEVWKVLDRYKRNGMIADFIPGEEFRLSNETTWELVKRDKSLKQDSDMGRGNRGITIVVL